MSVNHVCLTGNLTREPELRSTQSGNAVLGFGIAVNDRRKNPKTGEWEDYPNFVDCLIFGKRAESLSQRLTKGMRVAVDGKLSYSSWERDGQRRSKLEVVANEVEFMSRQGDAGAPGRPQAAGPAPVAAAPSPGPQGASQAPALYDEEIPF